jgi:hypothetical protein
MPIRLPRSAPRHCGRSYLLLVRRLSPKRALRNFEGQLLRPGALVEEAALWPDSHYPLVPLVIEYAGTDGIAANGKPARGHNRARDIRVLWRFDRGRAQWDEVARIASEGSHWYAMLAPLVERELVPAAIDHAQDAREAAGRLAALIDGALAELSEEAREHALAFLYDQVAARFAGTMRDLAAGYGPLFRARREAA